MPELLAQPQLWPHGWALVLRMNLLQHRNSTACSETWCAAEFVQNEGTNQMRKLYLTTENTTGQERVLIFFAFQKKAWFLSNGSTQTFWKINLGRVPQTQGRAFCQVWPQIRQEKIHFLVVLPQCSWGGENHRFRIRRIFEFQPLGRNSLLAELTRCAGRRAPPLGRHLLRVPKTI